MPESERAVGIDCGKDFLDVGVFPGAGQHRVANTPAGHRELVAWIAERGIGVAGLEASGVIADFYHSLIGRGKPPKVALAACMRKLIVRLNAMLAKGASWEAKPA